jgi:hypothetical protein
MVIYGLTAYMQARGESGSPIAVDVSVNGTPLKSVSFDQQSLTAPDPVQITATGREGDNDIRVSTRGAGTVYWAATARYFDTRTPIERTGDRKLAIARDYFMLSPVQTTKRTITYRETPFNGNAKPGRRAARAPRGGRRDGLALPAHRRHAASRRGDDCRRWVVPAGEAPAASRGEGAMSSATTARCSSRTACQAVAWTSGIC